MFEIRFVLPRDGSPGRPAEDGPRADGEHGESEGEGDEHAVAVDAAQQLLPLE